MSEDHNISVLDKKKSHRDPHSGRKADKKKKKNEQIQELTDRQRNPKAFAINSVVRAERRFRRNQDLTTKKHHIPVVDRAPLEPAPYIVAVVGPPKVGKSLLIQCLIKSFARMPLTDIRGPVTLVSGKKRRITLIECNNDINSMIDIGKVADLVLLLVDAAFGFEMEVFEFLNICQVHGMPRVMGVLTHLDEIKQTKKLKQVKKKLKHRFWTEVYAGAKLFYLSGVQHGEYLRNEIANLGRFISVIKFRPLTWRSTHSYILADRIEDLTPPELIRQNPRVDRTIAMYGYMRGIPLNKHSMVHIPGAGDFRIREVSALPDPCPLPGMIKKRSLGEKERLVYAPFSGVGGIVYDKDAVYVELGGSHSHTFRGEDEPGNELLTSMLANQETLDAKMERSQMQLFTGAKPITAKDVNDGFRGITQDLVADKTGRIRRKAVFSEADPPEEEAGTDDEDNDDEDEDDDNDSGTESLDLDSKEAGPRGNISRMTEGSDDDSDSEQEAEEVADDVPWNSRPHSGQGKPTKAPKSIVAKKTPAKSPKVPKLLEGPTKKAKVTEPLVEERPSKKVKVTKPLVEERPSKKAKATKPLEGPTKTPKVKEPLKGSGKKAKSTEPLGSIRSAERKLAMSLGEDYESSGDADWSDVEDAPEVAEPVVVKPQKAMYRELATAKDRAIRNKISETLSQLDTRVAARVEEEDDEDEDEDDEEMSVDDEEGGVLGTEGSGSRWKANLAQKAADAFLERQSTTQNLWKLVYGHYNEKLNKLAAGAKHVEDEDEDDEDDAMGGLFRIVNRKQRAEHQERDAQDATDDGRFAQTQTRDWQHNDVRGLIGDTFVTGKWGQGQDAAELLRMDDDDEMYGDFEDLETGETQSAEVDPGAPGGAFGGASREKLAERKAKLKASFDAEYDDREGGKSFYEDLKSEASRQGQLNRDEFEGMPEEIRQQLEGYRAGLYVRVEIPAVPCELIDNFDPTYPLILGGLQTGEENIGYVQVRVKKHRWHKRILKTGNPLVISLGWRRFQSLCIFAKLEDNLRHRYLKYTPEHVACMAHFWGPITPQNTGFLAVLDIATRQAGFRIAATGTVVELSKSVQVMKKLKLTGTPMTVLKKTAFVQGMFTSALEVAQFEGAKIRTVSGIRGQIKKALGKPEGAFRATFEDMIRLSDIVFCRTWYQVTIPQLYNPVTSLLLPGDAKNSWTGMKTVAELKREIGLQNPRQKDSLYTPVVRKTPKVRPLYIPKSLQRALPYKDKPKSRAPKAPSMKRVAVIREPHERKVAEMISKLKTSFKARTAQQKKETSVRMTKHAKKMESQLALQLTRRKATSKLVNRDLGQMQAKAAKKNMRASGGKSRRH